MDAERLVLTATEAAKALNLSMPSFYLAIKRNQIPHIYVGHRLLIPRASFQKWLDSQGESHGQGQLPAAYGT